MHSQRFHLRPLPSALRWLLALLLVLNGSVATPAIDHAAVPPGHAQAGHATAAHCHAADAAATPAGKHDRKSDCPCCFHGDACQCARVVASVPPPAFPDLRPLTPQALSDRFHAPVPAAEPRCRLLRPPIPASTSAALAA